MYVVLPSPWSTPLTQALKILVWAEAVPSRAATVAVLVVKCMVKRGSRERCV